MTETWRAIPGLEGRYEVSDLGRVRSLVPWKQFRGPEPRVLRPKALPRISYQCVDIGGTRRYVHRLVLEAFVGPCPVGCQAAHGNGDPADNRLDNLQWKTCLENTRDKVAHGTQPYGGRCILPVAMQLSEQIVREMRAAVALGESVKAVARRYGINRSTALDAVRRRTWRHVP